MFTTSPHCPIKVLLYNIISTDKMDVKTTTKKMRGFMCHSPAATAVCMSIGDRRSVVVPSKRVERTMYHHDQLHRHTKLLMSNNLPSKYSRFQLLVDESPRHSASGISRRNAPAPDWKLGSSTMNFDNVFQVVVMRVALHCQGCAGKVKKHLSKMEGVTSFSIDLESKRVTVMGHVSPLGVLESISKVKRAEMWTC